MLYIAFAIIVRPNVLPCLENQILCPLPHAYYGMHYTFNDFNTNIFGSAIKQLRFRRKCNERMNAEFFSYRKTALPSKRYVMYLIDLKKAFQISL